MGINYSGKTGRGKGGRGVALYITDHLESMDLHLGMDEELTESLRFRVKGKAGGDIVVGFCYRLPDQEDRVDEALYKQIGAASHSQNMALIGNFNHPNICWRDNTVMHQKSKRFLESVDGKSLFQVVQEPMRKGAMLDLVLTNQEEVVSNMKLKDSLGCSDHEMVGVQNP